MEFSRLAHTFEELEQTSSRLTLIELLTQLFRSIEQPEEIEQVCYLVQGRIAPFFEALEMGMAEKSVARSLALAYHTTPEHVEALYATLGDMGLVAGQVNRETGGVSTVLSVEEIFQGLKAIAQTAGKGAVEQRSTRLVDLLTRVDSVSAKYVVRILLGNLRLGIGDATVLDALAKARWGDAKKRKLLEEAYLRNLSAQLIGRSLDIHFPRYRSTEKELSQFRNVLRTFQDALPFVEETDILLKHWEFCYQRSIGCVGNLRLMLVRAVRAALQADAKTLRWRDLKMHAFSEDQSYEMMREVYEDEEKLASKPDQHKKLLEMLGLPLHIESKTVPQLNVPQSEGAVSEGKVVQPHQSDEVVKGDGQELPSDEASASEVSSELQLIFADQSDESTNEAGEGGEAEENPSEEVPPKPLKRPKAESVRPFRRKTMRDRTGGPERKSGEKD